MFAFTPNPELKAAGINLLTLFLQIEPELMVTLDDVYHPQHNSDSAGLAQYPGFTAAGVNPFDHFHLFS